ncbi:MAG: Asp23/Gls24 family envelope stress response protein [Anaerolineae bacterium]|nr:Asp23/Gls24 family envelope stress response protein [Anaerolineae bacterium]
MKDELSAIPGVVTVEPSVLEIIARLSALEVPGVAGVAERDVDRFLGISGRSVTVEVKDDKVTADLHLIAGPDVSLLQLGRKVQYEVTRAIQRTLGMPVEAVNVHIEDVVYPDVEKWSDNRESEG